MRPNPKRTPKPDRRRTLELIAASPNGVTESLLIAHGVTIAQMVELVRAGHASAHAERVVAGSHTMEVATVRITDAGRKLLARDGTGR